MGEDGRRLKQISHEMPFKKLIWKFLLVSHWLASRENFASISLVSHWHFTGKPYSRNSRETVAKLSVQNWKTREFDHLTPSWAYTWKRSQKHPENMFSHKNNLKNMNDTNHFQKQTKRTKIFLVWSTYG